MKSETEVLIEVSVRLHREILLIAKHQPHLLKASDRDWESSWSNDLARICERIDKLSKEQDPIESAKSIINTLFQPSFVSTREYDQIISGITPITESQQQYSNNYLAALLVDADHFSVGKDHEIWLEEITYSRIILKMAFANWKNKSKDSDLHQRGYDLIHIPAGQDNTDGKMISFGEKIQKINPDIRKVFICSNDNIFVGLGSSLMHSGLEVFSVKQNASALKATNVRSQEIFLKEPPPIAIDKLIQQLEKIISSEQEKTSKIWIPFPRIAQLYFEKHHQKFTNIVLPHLNENKKTHSIFTQHPDKFAVNIATNDQVYVSLFSVHKPVENGKVDVPSDILCNKIADLLSEAFGQKNESISMATLASDYSKKYQIAIGEELKSIGCGKSFVKFLQKYPNVFKLERAGSNWKVKPK